MTQSNPGLQSPEASAPQQMDEPAQSIDTSPAAQYKYYSASGTYIGSTTGSSPETKLFNKAHYVILNDSDMIKNSDPVSVVKRDIERYRAELLEVPVGSMSKIMELNHLIKNLQRFLD